MHCEALRALTVKVYFFWWNQVSKVYEWRPNWNKSIHCAGRIDRPVAPKFRHDGICAKISMEISHPWLDALPCWCAEIFWEPKYFVDLFLASWEIFRPKKIIFCGPFYHCFKFSHLIGLFDHFLDLSWSICAECAPKFLVQSSICTTEITNCIMHASSNCTTRPLKISVQRQICSKYVDESVFFFTGNEDIWAWRTFTNQVWTEMGSDKLHHCRLYSVSDVIGDLWRRGVGGRVCLLHKWHV